MLKSDKKLIYTQLTLPGFGKYHPGNSIKSLDEPLDYESMMVMSDNDTRALIIFLIDKLEKSTNQQSNMD